MKKKSPDFIADLRLYTREEGGREGPTPPKIFRCILEYEGENYDCVLFLENIGSLSPGFRGLVAIGLLFPEYLNERLQIGTHFLLKERRIIGEGIIIQIMNHLKMGTM